MGVNPSISEKNKNCFSLLHCFIFYKNIRWILQFLFTSFCFRHNTGQQTFFPEIKSLVSIQFWVAESESGIYFFPSRQNFAVLPISWLPGLKYSFSLFMKKLWEISKI